VLALRALLEAAGQSELSEAQGTLRVVGARGVKEVHFAPGQADVVQRVDLTDWLDAAGTACTSRATPRSAYQLEVSGYRLATAPTGPRWPWT